MEDVVIRRAEPDEIPVFVEWAGKEGWNPGLHDGGCHYAVDPDGWFVAASGEEIVGTIALTNYDDSFSFGGFFIVKEEFRHTGIGWKLWTSAIIHAGNRNLGIDGVFEMQDRYAENSGFEFAYRNIRWEGTASGSPQDELTRTDNFSFAEIADYDTLHFPARRESFLKRWLDMPDSTSLAYPGAGGEIAGYGTIRRCMNGHKIGPLFADTPEIAEKILEGLTSTISGETFFFDTPEINDEAVKMAESRNMTEVFGTARMYTREMPRLPLENIFGVTSFELG